MRTEIFTVPLTNFDLLVGRELVVLLIFEECPKLFKTRFPPNKNRNTFITFLAGSQSFEILGRAINTMKKTFCAEML